MNGTHVTRQHEPKSVALQSPAVARWRTQPSSAGTLKTRVPRRRTKAVKEAAAPRVAGSRGRVGRGHADRHRRRRQQRRGRHRRLLSHAHSWMLARAVTHAAPVSRHSDGVVNARGRGWERNFVLWMYDLRRTTYVVVPTAGGRERARAGRPKPARAGRPKPKACPQMLVYALPERSLSLLRVVKIKAHVLRPLRRVDIDQLVRLEPQWDF